ncbi:putative leucine-rich repeat receptor-like protein kinase [Sesamum alatum]|uniref:Leucine-rich repeat receptor-like protein kinase n=1 Tax=Sesamum alatum TaxID=300844 RepID=A0AAE1Y689_9LAMI|nr:putative leucine-rich repeat receptor-like protein kinase [Sesamum alatum]
MDLGRGEILYHQQHMWAEKKHAQLKNSRTLLGFSDLSYNNFTGALPTSIGNLKNLSTLILVGCGLSGPIPDTIGSLPQLQYLSLASNNFAGPIPASIGNLSNLYLLDLANNKLSGTLPVSKGSTPGLDMLVKAAHFHLGKNRLSGELPPELFSSKLTLIHLLLENNLLTGSIPSSLGLVQTLGYDRALDRNSLGGSVPENLSNLMNVQDLFLANNKLTGPLPDLTGMNRLAHLDMSNNSFDAMDFPPWFSYLQSLTSLYDNGQHTDSRATSWDLSRSGGRVPQVKGAICFSFDELKKCTDNFSEMNEIGHGGYGKFEGWPYRYLYPPPLLFSDVKTTEDRDQVRLDEKTSNSSWSSQKVVDLALTCVQEPGYNRPTMGEVVKEIESIMESAGRNPNAESTSSSKSYEDARKASGHPYTSESLSSNSAPSPPP